MISDTAIVLERLGTSRLLIKRGHRNVADLEQLRRGEKNEIYRVMINRVDNAALVEQDRRETALLKFDAAGESGGAGTKNGNIKALHWMLKQSFDFLVNG